MLKGKKFTQLQDDERIKIEVLLNEGFSFSHIARQLGRSVSTISREFSRNHSVSSRKGCFYEGSKAQDLARKRHRLKPKRIILDESMMVQIEHWLIEERLSPKLISIKGRRQYGRFISHEWIYRWIWQMKISQSAKHQQWRCLYRYLKQGYRRKKRGNQRTRRGHIFDRVWIDERPAIANDRGRIGDMEADLVLGVNRQAGLLVMLDRKSRKTWLRPLKSKSSRHVIGLVKDICRQAGKVKTITFDNDSAFAEHYRLKKEMGTPTYFTHPYSSQEKGSVENRIGIVRMFFNKKTDFKNVSKAEIKSVEKIINNRPLRIFNYRSPNEIHIS